LSAPKKPATKWSHQKYMLLQKQYRAFWSKFLSCSASRCLVKKHLLLGPISEVRAKMVDLDKKALNFRYQAKMSSIIFVQLSIIF